MNSSFYIKNLIISVFCLIICVAVLWSVSRPYPPYPVSSDELKYDGEFVDLETEEAYWESPKPADGVKIRKVNENGHAIASEFIVRDSNDNILHHIHYPRVTLNGTKYVLRFEDSLITGYALADLVDSPVSMHYDVRWKEDYGTLKALLDEYRSQVQALT